jgi:uncharacterized protein
MSTQTFSREIELPVSADDAFAWHERQEALERLIPPWESVDCVGRSGNLCEGATVELINRIGPLKLRWLAEHYDFEPGKQFCDVQREGPFAEWNHFHLFRSNGSSETSVLEDRVKYRVPGGWLGRLIGGRWIRNKIERMFDYRHETTCKDLAAHAQYAGKKTLHVAVTGASGLVGSDLIPLLTTGGHKVTRMVRGEAGDNEVSWDPTAESFDASSLDGVDAAVHLAGENIAGGRWTAAMKQKIRDSRVNGTRSLCEALARMESPPKVLVVASAIGFYGNRDDEIMDESSKAGEGFLSDVCREWEDATQAARDAGIRVVNLRIGVVLSPKGGALAKMLTPFKLGGGGIIGNGRQYWSWISIDDVAGAIHHALMTDSLSGPVNAVAPNAPMNREFTKTLGRVLRRPTILPMPAFAAKLALGEMANDLLLASTRVEPTKLIESGYKFRQPTLEKSLRHILGK